MVWIESTTVLPVYFPDLLLRALCVSVVTFTPLKMLLHFLTSPDQRLRVIPMTSYLAHQHLRTITYGRCLH